MAFTPLAPERVDDQPQAAPVAARGFTPLSLDQIEIPTRQTPAQLQRQFPNMGKIPSPTLEEQIAALNVGGLEALGRLPGEIAAIPATLGSIAAGGQSSGLAGTTRRAARTLEELIQPIQNLTPTAFNALGDIIGQDIEYYDPNSPQIRNPDQASAGEIISNLITGGFGVQNIQRLPQVLREAGRTIATGATAIPSIYRARTAVEPFLSGQKAAQAEVGLERALQSESALARDIAESAQKQAGMRSEAAGLGREALATQRAARAAEGQITPEIVSAQTNIEQARTLPTVVLGQSAQEPAAFGRTILESVEKPLAQSRAQYTKAYDAVKSSLPSSQPKIDSQGLFDAAQSADMELSQGFEAFNRGKIRSIINESTRTTVAPSTVPQEIRNVYEGAGTQLKADLLRQYPELGTAPVPEIPKLSWDELQKRFQQINEGIEQAVKHGDTGDVRVLEQLKQGIRSDMENYASEMGTETFDRFNEANRAFQAHQQKFGLNRIQTLFRDDVVQNPRGVASKLIDDNNPSMVEAIKSIVSPEDFAQVQAQFSQKIFSPNVDTPFDASHFIKNFSKSDSRETLRAVYGQEGFNELNKIYEASKGFEKIEGLQKNLDSIQSAAETSAEAFAKSKKSLNNQFNSFRDADVQDKLTTVNRDVQEARKELDRVKNYRDLKDWARRLTGVNIIQAAADTPSGARLAMMIAAHLQQREAQAPYYGPLPEGGEQLPVVIPAR